MYEYYLVLILLISVQLEAIIMNAVKLKHPETGKIVYLLGDVHCRNELDYQHFKILTKFLRNNSDSDIFIDSFKNFFQEKKHLMTIREKKLIQISQTKKKNACILRAKELFKEIRSFAGKKIGHSSIELALFLKKLFSTFNVEYFHPNNLISRIIIYCNLGEQINVIPDIRIACSKEGVYPQETLLQKNIKGIEEEKKNLLKANLPDLKSLLNNYKNKPDKDIENLITDHLLKQASNSIDFLELNIIDYLANNPEKPLIAIIGALHVSKLYQLLISEDLGYQIDKLARFDPNDKNANSYKKQIDDTRKTCIKELSKQFIEEYESYVVIKKNTVTESLKKLKKLNNFFLSSIKAVHPEELNEFLK